MFATAPVAAHLLRSKRPLDQVVGEASAQPTMKRSRLPPSLRFKVPKTLSIPTLATMMNITVDDCLIPASYVRDTLRNNISLDSMPRNGLLAEVPVNELLMMSTCANFEMFQHEPSSYNAPSTSTIPILHTLLERQPASLHPRMLLPKVADKRSLLASLAVIHGLWANAIHLGLVESEIYELLKFSWEAIIRKLEQDLS